jgi:hypothetical protein
MLGPNIIISILENRYIENISLDEQRLPRFRPRTSSRASWGVGGKRDFLIRELGSLTSAHGNEQGIIKFYAKHGLENAEVIGLPIPKKGTYEYRQLQTKIGDEIKRQAVQALDAQLGAAEAKLKPVVTEPTAQTSSAASPEASPVTPNSAARSQQTVQQTTKDVLQDIPRWQPFSLEVPKTSPMVLVTPSTPSSTTGSPLVKADLERFPKPVGEPDSKALAIRKNEIEKAKETGKFPIQRYKGGVPTEVTPPPPPPPPKPGIPEKKPPLPPTRDEFTSFSLPQQGAYYAYDVGIVRDIPGMARLAHQWRIA